MKVRSFIFLIIAYLVETPQKAWKSNGDPSRLASSDTYSIWNLVLANNSERRLSTMHLSRAWNPLN